MKQYLPIMLGILCTAGVPGVNAQYVPNGDFEEWETRVLYEEPESWNTGNMEALQYNIQTATLTEDSYSGNYALRLESVATDTDTSFGYATSNGIITDGDADTLVYTGGIPITGIPDSLFGYFKCKIAADDTAMVLVSFKLNGSIIGQDFFPIVGSINSYTRLGWEIGYLDQTPDTAFIAITSSNPFNAQPGNWLQADSLWFGAISDSILNCDFEIWEDEAYQEPAEHVTANLITHFFGGEESATQITDAHSGDYAISIKAVETSFPNEGKMTDIVASFLVPYDMGIISFEDIPTFPVNFNPIALTGFYKFTPVVEDTAIVVVRFLDDEGTSYEIPQILLPADTYTPFTVNLIYPQGTTISEIGYMFSTTLYYGIGDGRSGEVGSELILDDLELTNPCDGIDYEGISILLPTCEANYSILDAGDGWDEYLWSTDETTQTIQTENGVFSITVTDNTSGCKFTDSVEVEQLICPCDTMVYEGISILQPTCEANFSVLDAGDGWDEYLWSTNETTQTIMAESGVFSVTVTDTEFGCEFTDSVEVSKALCDGIISTNPKIVSVKIYPNPSEGEFNIELKNFKHGEYTIEIISITGKSLIKHSMQSTSASKIIQFNLSDYPNGLYMVKIGGDKYSHYEKIMIE